MLFTKQVEEKLQIMINEPDLSWVPNFIALGIYFIFGTKFSWNEGIDICFNVKCVLLGGNFDFLGGYCSLPSGYWWLLLVTGGYCSLLVVPTFSIYGKLHDTIESNVRASRSLRINYKHFRPLLVQIMLEKLPNMIKLQISRKLGKGKLEHRTIFVCN